MTATDAARTSLRDRLGILDATVPTWTTGNRTATTDRRAGREARRHPCAHGVGR